MEDKTPTINWNQIIALVIVAVLTGGGVSFLTPSSSEHSHKELVVMETRVDVLWEAERARVAQQLGGAR